MNLKDTFLRSKVGRRMFLYFVLSALIPIVFLAVLYFEEISRLLDKQVYAQLGNASSSYRTALYERLLLVDELLRNSTGELNSDITHGQADVRGRKLKNIGLMSPAVRAFRRLAVELPSGEVVPVIGEGVAIHPLSADKMAHLARGEPLLLSHAASGRPIILMSRALDPLDPKRGVVTAEINPEYLWGAADAFPYMTEFCVLDQRYEPLFCPEPYQPGLIKQSVAATPGSSKGQFVWRGSGQDYLASFGELFMQPKFFEARWLVVASQSESIALNPIATFSRIFWGSLALSVLVAVLLSMTQIRRILIPLTRLTDGTRSLGGRDFAAKVDVTSQDEFGELAESFNTMSSQLGRQFDVQAALSQIDQAILSDLNINTIIRNVLLYLRNAFAADYTSIVIFDKDAPEKSTVYLAADSGARPPIERTAESVAVFDALLAAPNGLWIEDEAARHEVRAGVEDVRAPHVFALPIIWKSQLTGLVSFGYQTRPVLAAADIKHIRDFADRVGVALSASARERLLYQQARIDVLTGLPNRFFFLDRLKQEIAQADRGGEKLAVLFVDLDRFKIINDSLGHAVGDELLRQAGDRLRQCVRLGDTVARLGGDEFVILLNRLVSSKDAANAADHVIAALSKPFLINQIESYVTASVGITVYPVDGAAAAELLRDADMAMYRAKKSGRGTYAFFEEGMNEEVVRRSQLERELRRAIAQQEFIVHYQPQINPHSGRVRSVEALVRWNHPDLGMLVPLGFIQVAEDTGLIEAIGQIVLAQACAQFRAWQDEGIQLDCVAVNVSTRQFRQANLVELVEAELKKNGMPGKFLELEITESVLLDRSDSISDMLARLKALGVKIAIDDFGTGYSSMAYLERLPLDTLKIDQAFIRNIDDEGEGGAIAATIVAMAKALKKRVVAEGVETQGQANFLRELDCNLLQGYFLCRPLPAHKIAAFIRETDLRRPVAARK
jgi:diguanylate cyclase (GGDEF)-like protein